MEQRAIKALLEQVAAGQVNVNDALLKLKMEPFEELGFAKLDSHRGLRQGVAEVIYGAGKTAEQIDGILTAMESRDATDIIVTRMNQQSADYVAQRIRWTTTPCPGWVSCTPPEKSPHPATLPWSPEVPVIWRSVRRLPAPPSPWAIRWSGCMMWALPDCTGCCPSWTC